MFSVTSHLQGVIREDPIPDLAGAVSVFQQRLAEASPGEVIILSEGGKDGDNILAFHTPSYSWSAELIHF